jgi:hypothetical protein
VSTQRLRAAVQRGDLRRECHGVHVPGLVPEGATARLAAHALLLPPGAAFSHATAGALLVGGLDLPERLTVTVPPPVRGPGRHCLRVVRRGCRASHPLGLARDRARTWALCRRGVSCHSAAHRGAAGALRPRQPAPSTSRVPPNTKPVTRNVIAV